MMVVPGGELVGSVAAHPRGRKLENQSSQDHVNVKRLENKSEGSSDNSRKRYNCLVE